MLVFGAGGGHRKVETPKTSGRARFQGQRQVATPKTSGHARFRAGGGQSKV
jgi:hypothetical protein